HVRNRGEIFRHDRGELKPRAKARLVPARKHSPRVRRFELSAEHDLLRAGALFLIRRVVKSLSLLIDPAGEIQFQAVWAGWQFARERKSQRLLFRIQLDGGGGKRFPIERRACDLDLESVQDQLP